MNKGDIVLVPFPFTDLTQTKLRPAIVLHVDTPGNDVTVCFVSSQGLEALSTGEFLLDANELEFQNTGLKASSKVRVTRIATIERKLVARRLGKLGSKQLQTLNSTIIQAFQLT
jgi:mRNA interferase MazF